jgi:ABC-type branched-subunit amino acid transport system permease subunit
MQEGQSSPRAWALTDQLRESMQNVEHSTGAEQALYQDGLTRVHELDDARRLRLLEAKTHIPTILWVILLAGGVVTVAFTYLFGLTNTRVHTLMVVTLAVVISSILFTIYTLEHHFSGDLQLTPDAFEFALKRFEGSL